MLTISKPTVFGPDGMAARGQCSPDSPGWQLRWFDARPPALLWQGAYKTCRHLQVGCSAAVSLEEAKSMMETLLNADSLAHFASRPTDAYPPASRDDAGTGRKKKKKKKY